MLSPLAGGQILWTLGAQERRKRVGHLQVAELPCAAPEFLDGPVPRLALSDVRPYAHLSRVPNTYARYSEERASAICGKVAKYSLRPRSIWARISELYNDAS